MCEVISNWLALKDVDDGYLMLRSLSGMSSPVILKLDHSCVGLPGTLTFRELRSRLRPHLGLEPKHSLRLCSERPWYRHRTEGIVIPDNKVLPASDDSCTWRLGTICYFMCTHLREDN